MAIMLVYRDPTEPLRLRCKALRSELDENERRLAEVKLLRKRRCELTRELVEAERALAQRTAPRRSAARRYALSAVGALGAVVVVLGTAIFNDSRDISAELALAPNRSVEIAVRTTPPDATVRIDASPPVQGPYFARVPLDQGVHRIVVSAPGRLEKTLTARFDHDMTFDVTLERDPSRTYVEGEGFWKQSRRHHDCDPPFVIRNGIKEFKRECL